MNRIQKIRTSLGLTQDGFAQAVGVAQGTVSRWESGEIVTSTPSWRAIKDVVQRAGKPWRDSWAFEAADGAA